MRILSQNTKRPTPDISMRCRALFVLSALHGSRCLVSKAKFLELFILVKDLKASFGSLFLFISLRICLHLYDFLTSMSTKCLISFSLFQYVLEHFHKKEFTKRKRYVKIKARYSQSNLALSLFGKARKILAHFCYFLLNLCAIFGILTTETKHPFFYPTLYFVPPLSGSLVLCQISCLNGADKSRKIFYGDVSHGFF